MLPSVSAAPLTAPLTPLTTPRSVSLPLAAAVAVEATAVAAAAARATTSEDDATLDRYERELARPPPELWLEGATAAAAAAAAASVPGGRLPLLGAESSTGIASRTACAAGAGAGAGGEVPALIFDAAVAAVAPVLAGAGAAAAGSGWLAAALHAVAGGGGGGGRASGFCGPPPPPVVVSCRSVMVAARDVLEINEKCYTYDAFCDVMLPHITFAALQPIHCNMGGLSTAYRYLHVLVASMCRTHVPLDLQVVLHVPY